MSLVVVLLRAALLEAKEQEMIEYELEVKNMAPVIQETEVSVEQNGTQSRRQKNEAARQLLKQWLEDTSGYDEQAWPEAKRVIEQNRLSVRRRFSD